MKRLLGKPVADRVQAEIEGLIGRSDPPRLVIYMIGSHPSSEIYVRSKVRKGERLGIDTEVRELPSDISLEEARSLILLDGGSDEVDGIMIESPLPRGLNMYDLVSAIPPEKDVEGVTCENYGLMSLGRPRFIPPTPLGALLIMLHYSIDVNGKDVVVVGRGRDVGRPLSTLLSMKTEWGNGTVTLAHSRTADLGAVTRRADILLTGVGRRGLIGRDMVKEGAVVIDMGINAVDSGIVGDVDVGSLDGWASMVTPTPGGTGPVTVSAIFLNLMMARMMRRSLDLSFKDAIIQALYGQRGAP